MGANKSTPKRNWVRSHSLDEDTLLDSTASSKSKSSSTGSSLSLHRRGRGIRRTSRRDPSSPLPQSSYAKRESHAEDLLITDIKSTFRRIRAVTSPESFATYTPPSPSPTPTPNRTPQSTPSTLSRKYLSKTVSAPSSANSLRSSSNSSGGRDTCYSLSYLSDVDLRPERQQHYERKYKAGRGKRSRYELTRSRHGQKHRRNFYGRTAPGKTSSAKLFSKSSTSEVVTNIILEYIASTGGEFGRIHLNPTPQQLLKAKHERWLALVLARKEVHSFLVDLVDSLDVHRGDSLLLVDFPYDIDMELSKSFSTSPRSMDCELSVSTGISDCGHMEISRSSRLTLLSSSSETRSLTDQSIIEIEAEEKGEEDGKRLGNVVHYV